MNQTITTESQKNGTTLVIGATGKTGRRVVSRLQARGLPVRAASRSSVVAFDWAVPASWAPVLEGVDAVYITYSPDLSLAEAADQVGAFARQAVAAGARRLVLLSGRGEPGALRSEEALKAAGADWTVVRSSWFAQNFSKSLLLEPILQGEVAFPAGDVTEPFIDVEDLADVVVAALTQNGHSGQTYEVSGPRLLSFADAIEEISNALARKIRYVPITPLQYASALVENGWPQDVATGMVSVFAEVLDGRNAYLADGVQKTLNRPAREFSDYVKATAALGVWNSVQTSSSLQTTQAHA